MAKRKSPAFSFYPADWLSSPKVTAMTSEEEGAYIRLLCYAWGDPDCALPDDDVALAALSRLGKRWNNCSAKIRSCFTANEKTPGKLFNKRLLVERKRQKENSRVRSEAGIKSGRVRRKSANKCSTNVQQMFNKTRTKTNLSSSSSSSSSLDLTLAARATAFDHFWSAYPKRKGRKVGKQKAAMLFANLSADDQDLAVHAAANYADSDDSKRGFARDAERFLKSSYWRDWIDHVESPPASSRVPTDDDLTNWNASDGGLGVDQ